MSASSPVPVIPGSRAPHGIARGLIPGGQREAFSTLCFDVWTCCQGGREQVHGGRGGVLTSLVELNGASGGGAGRIAQVLSVSSGWTRRAGLALPQRLPLDVPLMPARQQGLHGTQGELWVCCGRGVQSAWERREGRIDRRMEGAFLVKSRSGQASLAIQHHEGGQPLPCPPEEQSRVEPEPGCCSSWCLPPPSFPPPPPPPVWYF